MTTEGFPNVTPAVMPQIEFDKISKRFPGVQALSEVSFGIEAGSCHALLGENGAGKSTLGKVLAGVYTTDSGTIRLDGKSISPADPLAARKLGIAMVHQELAFCPNLTVAENLCLGELPNSGGWLDRGELRQRARRMLDEIEAHIDVDARMVTLSTGQEQMAQIAAALGTQAKIIVMDEPTSSLSALESEHLFTLLDRLKRRGITVIYVSHRMEEIIRLCDRVTVLRDGRHVSTRRIQETTAEELIHEMIGRDVTSAAFGHFEQPLGTERLRVENLNSAGKFSGINFSLRAGEILGFAGLVGAGRSEVAQAIFGLDPAASGRIFVDGKALPIGSVTGSLRVGIGLLPEDRKRQGLVLTMKCRENASLAALDRFSRVGFISRAAEQSEIEKFWGRLRVKAPTAEAPIAGLSGGNQQKIAFIKWLTRQCKVLIVDEPTRGVDVGSKSEIHQLLDELARQGLAILMISSELPELTSLARRIMVLRGGKVMGELNRTDFSQAALMRLMAGLER
jgi:ABC-type sugar transport system ATPase subunit